MRKRNVKDFPFSNCRFPRSAQRLHRRLSGRRRRADLPQRRAPRGRLAGTGARRRRQHQLLRHDGRATVLGRGFIDADGVPQPPPAPGAAPGAAPAVPAVLLISYDYWQRRFGGKPDVLGKTLPAGAPGGTQIVGVLAPGFELLFPPDTNTERLPDIWFALAFPTTTPTATRCSIASSPASRTV